jgi:hypothetical protein
MNDQEQHIFFRAIKDYWPIIVAISALVINVAVLGMLYPGIKSEVEAKADKEVVEVKLDNLDRKLDGVDKKVDLIIQWHVQPNK